MSDQAYLAYGSEFSGVADAIRAKTGGSSALTWPAGFESAIEGIPAGVSKVATTFSIDNAAAKDFDENVTYTSDYSTTQMGTYDHPTSYTDYGRPAGASPSNIVAGTMEIVDDKGHSYSHVVANEDKIYNLAPGSAVYKITDGNNVLAVGNLTATGKIRFIRGTTLKDFRDIGGWACDGGTVNYGKLFRTAELTGDSRPTEQLTNDERAMLVNLLGIGCELDLRDTSEQGGTPSFGSDVEYLHQTIGNYKDAINSTAARATFKIAAEKCMTNAIKGVPTLYHCVAGADRTGTLTWLLLALLGVSQSDCDKEYELTCLSGPTRFRNKDYSTGGYLSGLYSYVMSLGKSTFKDNVIEVFRLCGVKNELVNDFRTAMIDGTPSAVSYDVPAMSITQNGTYDVSAVNQVVVAVPSTPVAVHSGEFTPATDSQSETIDVGFSGCSYLSIFAKTVPATNCMDSMAWNSVTGFAVYSRYRGTYNGSYDYTSGSVTVSGQNVTVAVTQANVKFNGGVTYKWVAM